MSKTTKQTVDQIQADLNEALSGNQCGPKGPPKLTLPEHMRNPALGGGYVNDNAAATRARQAERDRARFGPPAAPKKP
jgi:hypothetical protein